MTAEELRKKFNRAFGLEKWPKTYAIDHETYANVCQFIFESKIRNNEEVAFQGDINEVLIALGPNNGIMFKNVELVLNMQTVEPVKKEEKTNE